MRKGAVEKDYTIINNAYTHILLYLARTNNQTSGKRSLIVLIPEKSCSIGKQVKKVQPNLTFKQK